MRYILLIIFFALTNFTQVHASAVSEMEEKFEKIKKAEDIFFIRLTILTDRLTVKEAELKVIEESYKKTLIVEEIKMIKENIEREKVALRKKIDVIENGLKPPVPPEMTERINKTRNLFHYFVRK